MENELDKFFKFKIGDMVKHIGRLKSHSHKQEIIFIMDRLMEQCPGGIQIHYSGRVVNDVGIATSPIRFNEVELVEYNPKEDD